VRITLEIWSPKGRRLVPSKLGVAEFSPIRINGFEMRHFEGRCRPHRTEIRHGLTNADLTDRKPIVPPTKEVIDTLYQDEILRARRMSPEDKILAGARLFDYACQITAAGIRNQFAGIDEDRVHEILRQRLAWRRKLNACRRGSESTSEF
jgi:hypothetical protein